MGKKTASKRPKVATKRAAPTAKRDVGGVHFVDEPGTSTLTTATVDDIQILEETTKGGSATANKSGAQRLSRHKKKYWRKGVDVHDVEAFLESERRVKRKGGPLAARPDAALFVVEKTGGQRAKGASFPRKHPLDGLRCFRAMEPDPLIEPAKVSQTVVWQAPVKRQKRFAPTKSRAATVGRSVSRDVPKERKTPSNSLAAEAQVYDLWGGVDSNQRGQHPSDDLVDVLTKEVCDYTRLCGGHKPLKAPKTLNRKEPSSVPTVEVAHPGASYNPDLGDYQALLNSAAATEVEKLRQIEKRERAWRLPHISERATEKTRNEELREGLFEEENDEAEADDKASDDDDGEYRAPNANTIGARRKTKAQRRRETERAEAAARTAKAKAARTRANAVFSLKSIKQGIVDLGTLRADRSGRKAQRREAALAKPRRLAPSKWEAPDEAVALPEELVGSLRLLKPEGSLLHDRFKSLQKRNLIDSRSRITKNPRRNKTKSYETRSYKAVAPDHKPI